MEEGRPRKKLRLWVKLLIVLLVLMLIPIRFNLKDGGSRVYAAGLYMVRIWHAYADRASPEEPVEFIVGTTITLPGIQLWFGTDEGLVIFDNTRIVPASELKD